MERGWILGVVCFAFMIVGAVHTVWQIFKIVELDARSRGIKHPGLWGFISANSNGASGLILYLIGRRNYPVISLSEKMKKEIDSRKRTCVSCDGGSRTCKFRNSIGIGKKINIKKIKK